MTIITTEAAARNRNACWLTPPHRHNRGKQLQYVFGVAAHGVADVTRRYTALQPAQLATRRTAIPEASLQQALASITAGLRAELPPEARAALQQRDQAEAQALARGPAATVEALPGRMTGSEAWRSQRGVRVHLHWCCGDGGVACDDEAVFVQGRVKHCVPHVYSMHIQFQSLHDAHLAQELGRRGGPSDLAPPLPPGTRYTPAPDQSPAGCLQGGAVRASGDNPPSETAAMAFEATLHSKWLDFKGAAPGGCWLEYRLAADAPPVCLTRYEVVSADDAPERDPCCWTLEGRETGRLGGVLGCRCLVKMPCTTPSHVAVHDHCTSRFQTMYMACCLLWLLVIFLSLTHVPDDTACAFHRRCRHAARLPLDHAAPPATPLLHRQAPSSLLAAPPGATLQAVSTRGAPSARPWRGQQRAAGVPAAVWGCCRDAGAFAAAGGWPNRGAGVGAAGHWVGAERLLGHTHLDVPLVDCACRCADIVVYQGKLLSSSC